MLPRTMAELSVLGSCLIDRDAMPLCAALTVEMFEREQYQRMFRAMRGLHARSVPIDVITVSEEMKRAGEFDLSDLEWMAEILDAVPTAVNVAAHAEIVARYAEGPA